jgi:hypothetical protein
MIATTHHRDVRERGGLPATEEGEPSVRLLAAARGRKRKATVADSTVDRRGGGDENRASLNIKRRRTKTRVSLVNPVSPALPAPPVPPASSAPRAVASSADRRVAPRPDPGPRLLQTIRESVANNPRHLLQCAAAETNDVISEFLGTQVMWQRDMRKADVAWSKAIGIPMQSTPYKNPTCEWKKYTENCIVCCKHRWNRDRACLFPNPDPSEDVFSAPGCEGSSMFLWSHGLEWV